MAVLIHNYAEKNEMNYLFARFTKLLYLYNLFFKAGVILTF